MQTMPIEVVALLKSKRQVGAEKPTYEVSLGGLSGSVGTNRIEQGVDGSNYGLSNWIETTDGRYMACWFDPTNKRLRTGYCASLAFRVQDFAVENYVEDANITVSEATTRQTCLFRRGDGKVLLVVGDTKTLPIKFDCYISNGNGDDWQFLSNVQTKTATSGGTGWLFIGVPVYTPTGRLIFSFTSAHLLTGKLVCGGCVAYSDDHGASWSVVEVGGYYAYGGVGQLCCLPDGTLFMCRVDTSGDSRIYQSTDNGVSWSNVADFAKNFSDAQVNNSFGHSFLYDAIRGYVICLVMGVGNGFFILPNPSKERFVNLSAWHYMGRTATNTFPSGLIYYVGGKIVFQGGVDLTGSIGSEIIFHGTDLPVKSIEVQRNQGMAAVAIITLDNKDGLFSPDNNASPYKAQMLPNKEVSIRLGYGAWVPQVFAGYIDAVEMKTFPAEIIITARDAMKRAIDQLITTIDGTGHVLTYENKTLEYMFRDLCTRAGIPVGVCEETGITITSKTFSWEAYIDAFDWMADLCGFEYGADELGVAYFRKKQLPESPEPAYRFAEGEDIVSLGYLIDDSELYHSVVVFGKDSAGNAISVSAPWVNPDFYGLSPQKIMKIDAPECDTLEKCTQVLQHAIRMITSRARQVDFAVIGQPYLQIGDYIKVVESTTTISEIYRITELSHEMDDGGYISHISCHWYSYG